MTTSEYGAPDFQKPVQSRTGNLFAAASQTLPTGTTYTGVLAFQSWPAVMLRVQPSQGDGTVTLWFYGDSGKTEFIGAYSWDVNGNVGLFVVVPSLGPYMEVGIDVKSVTSIVADTWLCGTIDSPGRIYYPNTQNGLYAYDASVAASSSDDYYPGWIQKGLAWLIFDPGSNGPSLSFEMDALSAGNAILYNVIKYYEVSGLQQVLLAVPDQIIRIRVTNLTTTGPLTYSFALVTQATE